MSYTFNQLRELATLVASAQFNGIRYSSDNIFLLFLKGQALGLHPMTSLDFLQVIQGKVTLSPQGMLALIHNSKQLIAMSVETGTDYARVTMQSNVMTHTAQFTLADAQAMGLTSKDNWRKQPSVMLTWRAVSACCRIVFPHIIGGHYTTEELNPDVVLDEEGKIITLPNTTTPTLPASNTNIQTDATPTRAFVGSIKTITRTKSNGWTVITDNGTAYTTRAEAFHNLGYDANLLLLNESTHDVMGVVEADWFENDKWSGYVVKRMYIPNIADELQDT